MLRAALLFLFFAFAAYGQQSGVQQSGPITPGHPVCWTTQGVVQDCGTPDSPFATGLGIQSSNAGSICINNGPNTGPYNALCFGVTATDGEISLTPFGGAAGLPLNIIVNGVPYPFPPPGAPFLPLTGGQISGSSPGSIVVGSPSGGDKGPGTINTTGLFVNGLAVGTGSFLPLSGGTVTGPTTFNDGVIFPRSVYYAQNFGSCTWDATHDVSPCIQAAINAVAATTTIANGGGTVVIPSGTYGISSTLSWSVPNVSLAGAGVGNVYGNNLTANSATILNWIGAAHGTMISVMPPSSGGNPISGDNVTGIQFNCNAGLADIGFIEKSISKSKFDIGYRQCGTNGVILDVQSNMVKFNDTQQNEIWIQGYDDLDGTIGVLAAGTSSGGISFGNNSENFYRLIHVVYKNGDGVHFDNTDHNQIDMFLGTLLPTGTGNAWIWNGSNDVNNNAARYNNMTYAAYSGAMIARGTSSFTFPSFKNWISKLAIAQNGTSPVIETGATLCITGADSQMLVGGCSGTGLTVTTRFSPLQAQVATSDVTGGNARGDGAVDLQLFRTNANQVANGASSTISGGESNTASGPDSVVPGGLGNLATGSLSFAAGGNALADLYGAFCYASGTISSGRRAQVCMATMKARSAGNTTQVRLTTDLLAAGSKNCINFLLGASAFNMRVQLTAIDTVTPTNIYSWTQPVDLLAQPSNAASTLLVTGTPVILASGTTSGIVIAEAADTTNGCYDLRFTPPTSNLNIWDVAATVTWTRTD